MLFAVLIAEIKRLSAIGLTRPYQSANRGNRDEIYAFVCLLMGQSGDFIELPQALL